MTALRCAVYLRRLPSRVGRQSRHASACLRCQAAGARYGALSRRLRDLRLDEAVAPPHLVDGVMGALDAVPVRVSARGAAVAIGGTAVAIAAAAAIAGLRHRRVA